MKFTREGYINGATLLGTAIAMFSFDKILQVSGWKHWIFILATFFFLGNALMEFWGLGKK